MGFLCLTCFVFACSSLQTKLCVLLLVLMTHAIEDLPTSPEADQTFPIPIEAADNGIINNYSEPPSNDGDQWENEGPGPLSSEKTEEKLITNIKKVQQNLVFCVSIVTNIDNLIILTKKKYLNFILHQGASANCNHKTCALQNRKNCTDSR